MRIPFGILKKKKKRKLKLKRLGLQQAFLVDLKIHIDEVNELAKTSESEKCKDINAPDLYQTHEAFAGRVQKLRDMPTGTEDEFTAFKVTMGSVNLQVPIIILSILPAKDSDARLIK